MAGTGERAVLLKDNTAGDGTVKAKKVLKFDGSRKYKNNLQLAFFTAFWIVLFGLPVVSEFFGKQFFGEPQCDKFDMGWKMIVGEGTDPKIADSEDGNGGEKLWCGWFPESYKAWWPNVVQFCFFTVYANTGTTISYAWQGIAGTALAIFNARCMKFTYHHGANLQDGDAYNTAIAWTDMALFSWIVIYFKFSTGTKMFALAWHVYFMMEFINPKVGFSDGHVETVVPFVRADSEMTQVMLTSVMGAFLAIMSTMLPFPLLNIKQVSNDMETTLEALEDVWGDAIEYFCGKDRTPKRFQIEGKLSAIAGPKSMLSGNLTNSWWETLNLGSYGTGRALYRGFLSTLDNLEHQTYVMEGSLLAEEFDGEHVKVCSGLRTSMLNLKEGAIGILRHVEQLCKDGKETDANKAQLKESVEGMVKKQADLYNAYKQAMESQPYVSIDLSNENVFVYALASWARRITDFAEDIDSITKERNTILETLLGTMKQGFMATWMHPDITGCSKDHFAICLCNYLPIMLCFWAGAVFDVAVYTPYSGTMAGTLALLITTDNRFAFRKNLHRLMGVTIGNVLPLLMMSIVNVLPCHSPFRSLVHALALGSYTMCFAYMYYTSPQFAYLGCLIGGFGAYPLLASCKEGPGDNDAILKGFGYTYEMIAQVVTACLVRMVLESLLRREEPRDIAVKRWKELGEAFEAAYVAFFDGNLTVMHDNVAKAKGLQAVCADLAGAVDPKLDVCPGKKVDFKVILYTDLCAKARLMVSDLEMTQMAMKKWAPINSVAESQKIEASKVDDQSKEKPDDETPAEAEKSLLHGLMSRAKAFQIMKADLLKTLRDTWSVSTDLISQDTEARIESTVVQELEKMTGLLALDGVADFYSQINEHVTKDDYNTLQAITASMRVRLTVATRSLRNATRHMGEMEALCLHRLIN